ncbi:hypothetical protein [Vibrio sp. CyArs1]|uniref:hypothetical protein n=1 Tax=Vibrio sp. CyArs1 TaxID=2682577 RepID=UPI001F05697E|nr:hypothetical protein [Vibrio sp. CyArs1]
MKRKSALYLAVVFYLVSPTVNSQSIDIQAAIKLADIDENNMKQCRSKIILDADAAQSQGLFEGMPVTFVQLATYSGDIGRTPEYLLQETMPLNLSDNGSEFVAEVVYPTVEQLDQSGSDFTFTIETENEYSEQVGCYLSSVYLDDFTANVNLYSGSNNTDYIFTRQDLVRSKLNSQSEIDFSDKNSRMLILYPIIIHELRSDIRGSTFQEISNSGRMNVNRNALIKLAESTIAESYEDYKNTIMSGSYLTNELNLFDNADGLDSNMLIEYISSAASSSNLDLSTNINQYADELKREFYTALKISSLSEYGSVDFIKETSAMREISFVDAVRFEQYDQPLLLENYNRVLLENEDYDSGYDPDETAAIIYTCLKKNYCSNDYKAFSRAILEDSGATFNEQLGIFQGQDLQGKDFTEIAELSFGSTDDSDEFRWQIIATKLALDEMLLDSVYPFGSVSWVKSVVASRLLSRDAELAKIFDNNIDESEWPYVFDALVDMENRDNGVAPEYPQNITVQTRMDKVAGNQRQVKNKVSLPYSEWNELENPSSVMFTYTYDGRTYIDNVEGKATDDGLEYFYGKTGSKSFPGSQFCLIKVEFSTDFVYEGLNCDGSSGTDEYVFGTFDLKEVNGEPYSSVDEDALRYLPELTAQVSMRKESGKKRKALLKVALEKEDFEQVEQSELAYFYVQTSNGTKRYTGGVSFQDDQYVYTTTTATETSPGGYRLKKVEFVNAATFIGDVYDGSSSDNNFVSGRFENTLPVPTVTEPPVSSRGNYEQMAIELFSIVNGFEEFSAIEKQHIYTLYEASSNATTQLNDVAAYIGMDDDGNDIFSPLITRESVARAQLAIYGASEEWIENNWIQYIDQGTLGMLFRGKTLTEEEEKIRTNEFNWLNNNGFSDTYTITSIWSDDFDNNMEKIARAYAYDVLLHNFRQGDLDLTSITSRQLNTVNLFHQYRVGILDTNYVEKNWLLTLDNSSFSINFLDGKDAYVNGIEAAESKGALNFMPTPGVHANIMNPEEHDRCYYDSTGNGEEDYNCNTFKKQTIQSSDLINAISIAYGNLLKEEKEAYKSVTTRSERAVERLSGILPIWRTISAVQNDRKAEAVFNIISSSVGVFMVGKRVGKNIGNKNVIVKDSKNNTDIADVTDAKTKGVTATKYKNGTATSINVNLDPSAARTKTNTIVSDNRQAIKELPSPNSMEDLTSNSNKSNLDSKNRYEDHDHNFMNEGVCHL